MKIEADPTGRFVFYGGDSFGTLEKRRGWLTNEGVIHFNRRKRIFSKGLSVELSTMKSLANGDTIVNDFGEGWDLILLDQNFTEKERLEGLGDPIPPYFRMI